MENEFCPCCGRHCPLDSPHCERGEEFAKTGVIPYRPSDSASEENRHCHEDAHGHHHNHCHRNHHHHGHDCDCHHN